MLLFDGLVAWFAPNVPDEHIHLWVQEGGMQVKDAGKPIVQYYFSNLTDDDDTTRELIRTGEKVLYRSGWIADSSHSRTKQPLGYYALQSNNNTYHQQQQQQSSLGTPMSSMRPLPHSASITVGRHATPQRYESSHHGSAYGGSAYAGSAYGGRAHGGRGSVSGNELYSPPMHHPGAEHYGMRHADSASVRSATRSIASSRHSAASSVGSAYGRRQQVFSRFVIDADESTRATILENVFDFTPNAHGFVAYKIPKLAQ
ncbi:hypothetical protein GGI07_005210 [Coemansia sp. Benny D115]|nr:hypothetical protein GGI07_005210 [Coemansia sp. Benny D115]